MHRIFSLITSLVLLAALSLPGLAQAEELIVYTALEDDQIPRYLESFQKAHPDIEAKIVRDSTGIVTAKLLAEKDNPQADVIWGVAATSLLLCDEAGMLEAYAPKGLDKVSKKYRDPANPPKWVGIDAWMTGFCINTIEAKALGLEYPQSMADLLMPEYQGQIIMPNPASSGTGFLTVSAILQMMGEEEGWAYLDKLHNNIARYTHSGSKPCKLAGSGETVIGVSFGYRGIIQKNKGEPVHTVFPKEGSGWDLEANALVKKATIKPAAKTFLDWAISPEVMKEYQKSFAVVAAPTGEPVPEGFPSNPEAQLIDNDFAWAAKNRTRILEEWSNRYDGKSDPK